MVSLKKSCGSYSHRSNEANNCTVVDVRAESCYASLRPTWMDLRQKRDASSSVSKLTVTRLLSRYSSQFDFGKIFEKSGGILL